MRIAWEHEGHYERAAVRAGVTEYQMRKAIRDHRWASAAHTSLRQNEARALLARHEAIYLRVRLLGSATAVARELGVSPQRISHIVKTWERRLRQKRNCRNQVEDLT